MLCVNSYSDSKLCDAVKLRTMHSQTIFSNKGFVAEMAVISELIRKVNGFYVILYVILLII